MVTQISTAEKHFRANKTLHLEDDELQLQKNSRVGIRAFREQTLTETGQNV